MRRVADPRARERWRRPGPDGRTRWRPRVRRRKHRSAVARPRRVRHRPRASTPPLATAGRADTRRPATSRSAWQARKPLEQRRGWTARGRSGPARPAAPGCRRRDGAARRPRRARSCCRGAAPFRPPARGSMSTRLLLFARDAEQAQKGLRHADLGGPVRADEGRHPWPGRDARRVRPEAMRVCQRRRSEGRWADTKGRRGDRVGRDRDRLPRAVLRRASGPAAVPPSARGGSAAWGKVARIFPARSPRRTTSWAPRRPAFSGERDR